MEFDDIFNSKGNEYISTLYTIQDKKSGKYKIEIEVPYLHIENGLNNEINKQINDVFINKILQIINSSEVYTTLKIDYATSINENIVSLAVRCILKEGSNAQRTIIKTYNFNLETNKLVEITELIPEEKRASVQGTIDKEIEKKVKKENTIVAEGYNVYRRNPESDIYILENAKEFFIKDNVLYIIYSYGNSSYTSEIDLIMTKI